MFIVGLEMDFDQLKKNWKFVVVVVIGGIIFFFVGGFGVVDLFGLFMNYVFFMGVLFSVIFVSILV